MKEKFLFIFLASLLLLLPLFSNYAFAGPFYEGKVIKLIVATNPGGGYDFYGRMTARYMQKYLPGIKPSSSKMSLVQDI